VYFLQGAAKVSLSVFHSS